MPPTKASPKSPPPAPPKKTAVQTAGRPMHPFAFALGIVAVLVGIYSAGVLSLSHFEILQPPGCGPGSGCAGAAASKFGSVPIPGVEAKWPTSHMGLAYFVAVGVVWAMSRHGMSAGLRLMIIAGTIGSLFYTTQIVLNLKQYFCGYCLASHAANLVLFALTFIGGGQDRGTPRALATGAMAFALSTAALVGLGAWSDKAARDKGEKELGASIETLVQKTDADSARAAATQTQTAPQPVANQTPTQPPASGDIVRGAPELRDRPLAITVQGLTSRRGFTGHYRIGYEDAPIRVVMFSGYQCADCQRVEKEMMRLLEQRNDIMFSHRHFPFARPCNESISRDMHGNACWAAIAAEVAGELYGPEGFWKMHQWLFDRRGAFTNEELGAGLATLGFDARLFNARMNQQMNGGELLKRIQADVRAALDLGLHYTPLMFVNGVEIRAFRTPGALTRAVMALAERRPPLGSPELDRPPTAATKYVDDWAASPVLAPTGKDRFLARLGPENATVRIEAWIDYSSPDTQELDAQIRDVVEIRDDTMYIVRLFPMSKECVPRLTADDRPHACTMAKAAEAAGQIAGIDAYFLVHDWLLQNREAFSIEALRSFLEQSGLDTEAIMARMEDGEVSAAIRDDTTEFYTKGMTTLPHVFVNYKDVPRWKLEGSDVIHAIVERAADGQ